jgi:hypothetical protein
VAGHDCMLVEKEAAVVGMAGSRSFGFVAWAVEKVGLRRCLHSRNWHSLRRRLEVLAMDIQRTVVVGIADSILGAAVVARLDFDTKY